MNFLTNLYNRIWEAIQEIRTTLESIQNFLETFLTILGTIFQFLKPIFGLVPWEVWVLLVVAIIFLSWVNNLFPTTPKWNYTVIVVGLVFLWAYSASVAFPEEPIPYFRIFRAASYLLLPVYMVGLVSFFFRKGMQKIQKSKRTKVKDLDEFIRKFDEESRRLIATTQLVHIGEESPEQFQKQVEVVLELLEKAKIKR